MLNSLFQEDLCCTNSPDSLLHFFQRQDHTVVVPGQ